MKIGKKLKKNNVAVDVVSFGDTTVNQALLEARIARLAGPLAGCRVREAARLWRRVMQ